MLPELTVVFVNHNSARFLDRALGSLRQSEPKLDIETIVVDNASCDRAELIELCRRHGARLLALARNAGYGAAANRGFGHARGRYAAVANPDLVFPSGAVAGLVRFLDDNPQAGVVSPQLVYPDGTPQPSCRRFPRMRYVLAGRRSPLSRLFPGFRPAREFLYSDAHRSEQPVDVEAVIGTFMVFRREALEQVEGFDERYFMFAEDLDICRRLRRAGWQVVLEPRVRVEHYYGGVRRQRRRFTEFHRIKALRRFFSRGKGLAANALLAVAFAGYLFASEASWLLGMGEFEYSWQGRTRHA